MDQMERDRTREIEYKMQNKNGEEKKRSTFLAATTLYLLQFEFQVNVCNVHQYLSLIHWRILLTKLLFARMCACVFTWFILTFSLDHSIVMNLSSLCFADDDDDFFFSPEKNVDKAKIRFFFDRWIDSRFVLFCFLAFVCELYISLMLYSNCAFNDLDFFDQYAYQTTYLFFLLISCLIFPLEIIRLL